MFIDHNQCPKCGTKLERPVWKCKQCGHQDLTNWPLTLLLWVTILLIVGIILLFMTNNFCQFESFQPLINNYGVMC